MAMLETETDKISIARIYNTYKTDMLKAALYITKNKEMSEDAVHDAFLSIIKHKNSLFLLPEKQLRSKVVLITKNKCIDMLRKNNHIIDDPIEDIEYMLKSNENPVENQVVLVDMYESIKKHISSLDESSKLILEMRYILSMTYKEISDEMGITIKQVDNKIMHAKKRVRKLVDREANSND